MRDDIHICVDSIAVSTETPLKDDPRCHELRLIARHGNKEWYDGEISVKDMFAMVEATGELPSTSQPPIGDIIAKFTELSLAGKKIICINAASVLSGTYQTFCVAAKQVMAEIKGADIRVVDGKTCGAPLSGMAIEVMKKIDEGWSLDQLEAYANDLVVRTDSVFSVNTLDYLQKGGRIGAVGALIGNIFGIRPIIHLDKDGKLQIADKCRTRKKVLKRLVELAAENGPIENIYVSHAESAEDAETLRKAMLEIYPDVPTLVTGIGTPLAAHLGPGVIGLFVTRKA